MARRKKKENPELLIVSFCDIVTITTAAMFFAMLITVQEAVKIPVYRPTPRVFSTKKLPVFFEVRGNEVFYVDKDGLDTKVTELMAQLNPGVRGGDIAGFSKALQGREIGNAYYTVNPKYLLVGVMALDARPGVKGEGIEALEKPNGMFQSTLNSKLDKNNQYVVFLVREDSFTAFRKARLVTDNLNFDSGFEMLGELEPVKFGQGGNPISPS